MKEAEKIVNIDKLGEDWLNNAFDSFEQIKKVITFLNETNSFDLYDNEEDLPIDKLNNKQAIKETLVVLPLTYTMEKFLKSIILYYDINGSQNRTTAVWEILNNVKASSSIKGNFHNIMLLTDYINNHIDSHFLNFFGNVYASRRKGYNSEIDRSNNYTEYMSTQDRIAYATETFKNAFVEFRYLYEKSDRIDSVDLVKLIDYVASIRDVALYLIKRKKALDYIARYKELDTIGDFTEQNFARIYEYSDCDGIDLLRSIDSDTDSYLFWIFDEINEYNWFSDEKKNHFFDIEKKIRQDICEPIEKLKHEYKPEFTRSRENQLRNN